MLLPWVRFVFTVLLLFKNLVLYKNILYGIMPGDQASWKRNVFLHICCSAR